MISTTEYLDLTVKLVRSLTVVSLDTAIQINNELVKIYGTSILGEFPEDKTTWKYYLNIAGEYHKLDNLINITIIEDGSIQKLTKELLENNPLTKNELLEFGDYYRNLVLMHPDDELLIKGIIHGLSIDEVLSYEDGSIIAYSPSLVEEQESNLIYELSEYSKSFFMRWHIKEYGIIDNLYLPALLATLYNKLVLKVLNIRMSNVYTSEVHSYHIYEFFRSNFGIDLDVEVLSKFTRFWLYKNLRYIRHHIGKNEILDTLIEKILTENGVGVAEVQLINKLPEPNEFDITNLNKPIYDEKENRFISKPRNEYYLPNDTDDITSKEMLLRQFNEKFVDNDILIKDTAYYDETLNGILSTNRVNKQKTKTFKVKLNKNNIVVAKMSMKMVLDNFIKHTMDGTYTNKLKFIDDNTGITYDFTAKQAVLVILKLIGLFAKENNPIIKSYHASKILNTDIDLETLNYNMLNDDVTISIAERFLELRPIRTLYDKVDTFKQYITDINVFDSMMWNVASNSNDMIINNAIKIMDKRLHRFENVRFDDEDLTIDELLSKNYVDFIIPDSEYDAVDTLDKLLYAFTGYYFTKDDTEELVDKYIKIIKTMSSHTIQFMNDSEINHTVDLRYNTKQSVVSGGIMEFKEATFKALEWFYGKHQTTHVQYGLFVKFDMSTIELKGGLTNIPPKFMFYDYARTEILDKMYGYSYLPNMVISNSSYLDMFGPDLEASGDDLANKLNIPRTTVDAYGTAKYKPLRSMTIIHQEEFTSDVVPNLYGNSGNNADNMYRPTVDGSADDRGNRVEVPRTSLDLKGDQRPKVTEGIMIIDQMDNTSEIMPNLYGDISTNADDMYTPKLEDVTTISNDAGKVLSDEDNTVKGNIDYNDTELVIKVKDTKVENVVSVLIPEVYVSKK